jgi:hypothetical protein
LQAELINMILLECFNRILMQVLLDRFEMAQEELFLSTELTFSDFDGAQFTVRTPGSKQTLAEQNDEEGGAEPADSGRDKSVLHVSMKLYGNCYQELQQHGLDEVCVEFVLTSCLHVALGSIFIMPVQQFSILV